ncbi:MAG: DUF2946 family protein [Polaromonas sp.]
MTVLRNAHFLARWVLVWFVLSIGVAVASPMVHPKVMQLVCSGLGVVKVVIQTSDGAQDLGSHALDCPLCVLGHAPPPPAGTSAVPPIQPLAYALQRIPAARIAAATAAPPPARGPPAGS